VAVWFVAVALLPHPNPTSNASRGHANEPDAPGALESFDDPAMGEALARFAASLAIAALLGRAPLRWMCAYWLMLGLGVFFFERPPTGSGRWKWPGSWEALQSMAQTGLAAGRRANGRWRLWLAWLGPVLLSWLALGGEEVVPAAAKLSMSPLAQLWAWASANAAWPMVAMGLVLPLALLRQSAERTVARTTVAQDRLDESSSDLRSVIAIRPGKWCIGGWLLALVVLAAGDHAAAAMATAMLLAASWPALVDPAMPADMARRRAGIPAGVALVLAALVL
jgi:hypothetical protein